MLNYENIKNNIIQLINNNNIIELKYYINKTKVQLKEINNDNFDILTYAIENYASKEIVEFIIHTGKYQNLNYTVCLSNNNNNLHFFGSNEYINYSNYKVPLFLALSRNSFEVADLLLKCHANINYTIDISDGKSVNAIQYLYHISGFKDFLNTRNVKYILGHGFNIKGISGNFLNQLVQNEFRNGLLETIFSYYIYDNTFILTLLTLSRYNQPLSDTDLMKIISREKGKIVVNEETYRYALNGGNYDAIRYLINYDSADHATMKDIIKNYDILEKAIKDNNAELVKKVFYFNLYEFDSVYFENLLIKIIENNNGQLLQLFIQQLKGHLSIVQRINYEKVLLVASKRRTLEILNYLLTSFFGISFNQDTDLDLSFIKEYDVSFFILILNIAIKTRHFALVKCLIQHKNNFFDTSIDINIKDRNNEVPIMISVGDLSLYNTDHYSNSIKIFEYLLANGANYNMNVMNGRYLLSIALSYQIYIAAKYLLKYDLQIEEKSIIHHYQPLMNAVYHHQLDRVKSLVNENSISNVYITSSKAMNHPGYGFTPLILSYLLNDQEVFQYLLQTSDIDALDLHGYSLLHYAILKEDVTIVNYLIERGADTNYRENKYGRGNSAFDITLHLRNKDIFFALLRSPTISINELNGQGEIPLMTVIKLNDYPVEDKLVILEHLISIGSDVNFVNRQGFSPLMYAIHCRSLPIVTMLVEHGANVNYYIKSIPGRKKSILMYAIETNDLPILQYLIENTNIKFTSNANPPDLIEMMEKGNIHWFKYIDKFSIKSTIVKAIIYYNKLDLLKKLLKDHFDINTRDENGDTLLAHAIRVNNKEIVYYLIDSGADLHTVNHSGESIYDISYKYQSNKSRRPMSDDNTKKIFNRIKTIYESVVKQH